MLDRVRISDIDNETAKIELSDETGIVIDVSVIPRNEWRNMRNKVIASLPANFQISDAIDYLTALGCLLEQN